MAYSGGAEVHPQYVHSKAHSSAEDHKARWHESSLSDWYSGSRKFAVIARTVDQRSIRPGSERCCNRKIPDHCNETLSPPLAIRRRNDPLWALAEQTAGKQTPTPLGRARNHRLLGNEKRPRGWNAGFCRAVPSRNRADNVVAGIWRSRSCAASRHLAERLLDFWTEGASMEVSPPIQFRIEWADSQGMSPLLGCRPI